MSWDIKGSWSQKLGDNSIKMLWLFQQFSCNDTDIFSIMGYGEDEGIIPRFSDELFQKIESLKENSDDVVRVVFCCPKFFYK